MQTADLLRKVRRLEIRSRHLDYLRLLRQTQFDPPDVIRARQLAALRVQLRHAFDTANAALAGAGAAYSQSEANAVRDLVNDLRQALINLGAIK